MIHISANQLKRRIAHKLTKEKAIRRGNPLLSSREVNSFLIFRDLQLKR